MKLILHHLLKDVRAQRWLLSLWAFLWLLQVTVEMLVAAPDYALADVADRIGSSPLLGLISWLTWMFLLVQLIQSEPVRGSTSFWLTRPIPRRVYLPSKLLFIVLFLMLPSLLVTPLAMLWFHADSSLIWFSLKSGFIFQALIVLVLLWLATFTRSLAQFVGVGLLLIPVSLLLFSLRTWISLSSSSVSGVELTLTRGWLFLGVFFLGLFVSLLLQHLRRESRFALPLGIGLTLLSVAVGFLWPFALPSQYTALSLSLPPASLRNSNGTIRVDYSPDWQKSISWGTAVTSNEPTASAVLTPIQPKGQQIPVIENITANFQPAGGQWGSLGTSSFLGNEGGTLAIRSALQADVPGITVEAGDEASGEAVSLFSLSPSVAARVRNTSGTLTLSIFGVEKTLVRKAVIPLARPFARIPGGVIHVRRVDKVTQRLMGMEIPVPGEEGSFLSVWTVAYRNSPPFSMAADVCLLVDPQTHIGTILQTPEKSRMPGAVLSSRTSTRDFLTLTGGEPLDRMVLYVYEFKDGDYINSSLTARDFKMSPP